MSSAPRLFLFGDEALLRHLKRGLLPLHRLADIHSPWLSGEVGRRIQQTLSDDQWQAALRARYNAIPEHLRVAVDFAYFAQQMEAKRDELEAELVAQGVGQDTSASLDLARHQALVAVRLSESVHNPLVWQLWGHQHQGLALELDSAAAIFQAAPGKPRLLRHVRYGARRTLAATDSLPFPGWFEEPAEAAALREWRLVLPLAQAKQTGDGPVLPLERNTVRGLYFGCLSAPALLEQGQALVRMDQRYRQVRVHHMVADQQSFSLYVES